jgi:hypothetical protein
MSGQWWGAKGSFETRAKQMAKQMTEKSTQNSSRINTDVEQIAQDRAPFKNRVEMMFAAISKPSNNMPMIPKPLADIDQEDESSSMPWVVADFPNDISALKRNSEQDNEGSNDSECESGDDAVADEDDADPRKQGLNNSIEVLDDNPYEQKCQRSTKESSTGSKSRKERRVHFSAKEDLEVEPAEQTVSENRPKAARKTGNTRPCFNFAQTGKCRFGDKCAFQHVVSDFVANPDKYTKYDVSWDEEEDPGEQQNNAWKNYS